MRTAEYYGVEHDRNPGCKSTTYVTPKRGAVIYGRVRSRENASRRRPLNPISSHIFRSAASALACSACAFSLSEAEASRRRSCATIRRSNAAFHSAYLGSSGVGISVFRASPSRMRRQAMRHKTSALRCQPPHMPARCGWRRGALLDKYPHSDRYPEHIKKLIPAGLWHWFARLALWCVQGWSPDWQVRGRVGPGGAAARLWRDGRADAGHLTMRIT